MSSIVLPSRGQCIQITDDSQPCQCQWFFPPELPLLDQTICGHCGHGIHAHADYISIVVNHYPANQCAAYAQRTHLLQFCICGAQFCEHIGTYNSYRIPEPWSVLRYFNPDTNGPSSSVTTSYFNDANSPLSPNTMSSDYIGAILSDDARNMSLTRTSTSSPSVSSSASPAIEPNTTQTILDYSTDGYFAQHPNYIVNSPCAGPSEGGATNESFQYQDYGNVMYTEPSEDWSGSDST
ncbi:hypothetical protein ARMSODRAFT_997979 [Armillaria solidipes]|uniref:Uncharacterized protein n=1 Tax=Armillaria solidipes TaxID=1076256 RepID=A0A2H3CQR8_9AGAR|nr:hypothetical protein ARMSODRAFT_997979 [Armillaria solidipes]